MSLTPSTITSGSGARKSKKRVGRGNASGKGTYSTRGLKGQRSRSGGKSGLQRRAFKARLQKIPKLRGFKSPHAKKELVTLASLDRVFDAGDKVTPGILAQKGLVDRPERGVKIVVRGELTKKLSISGCLASKAATEQIEKAGGTLTF